MTEIDQDWAALAPRLRQAYVPEVRPDDVTGLRGRVGGSIRNADHRPARRGWVVAAAAAMAAAAMAAAAIGLVSVAPVPEAGATDFRVSLTPGGETMFEFEDGRGIHRIVKTTCLETGDNSAVHVARGQRFVEPNGTPEPGTAVFYRVD
jgi:hypothetical protein